MTTASRRTARPRSSGMRVTRARLSMVVPVVVVVALAGWAGTAGPSVAPDIDHLVPGTVEHVEGSDASIVVLTPVGAEKIGLELVRIERTRHPAGDRAVPYAALIHDADGTVWVYATVADPLRFQRQSVEVAAMAGERAILTSGPGPGSTVAGHGAAELYGTEFEVGH